MASPQSKVAVRFLWITILAVAALQITPPDEAGQTARSATEASDPWTPSPARAPVEIGTAKEWRWATWVCYSPDGKSLVMSGDEQFGSSLWDLSARKQLTPTFRRLAGSCFMPEGKVAVISAFLNGVAFWDVASEKRIRSWTWNKEEEVVSVAVSPDGAAIAVVTFSHIHANDPKGSHRAFVIHLWDVKANKERLAIRDPEKYRGIPGDIGFGVKDVPVFSPDGKVLATTTRQPTIRLWDVASGKELRKLEGHQDTVSCVAFSPDGRLLASGASGCDPGEVDRRILIWDVQTGEKVGTLDGHEKSVLSVAFSPDGWLLASSSEDDTIRIWELATGKEILRFRDGKRTAFCVTFSPNGGNLATAMSGGIALIWDLAPRGGREGTEERPDRQSLSEKWELLAGRDSLAAYRTIHALSATPKETVAFLREYLRLATREDTERIPQLIDDLDNAKLPVRQAATKELERIGAVAAGPLRERLAQKPSVELRRRIDLLLDALDQDYTTPSPETLRGIRSVWVLERIGNDDARKLLEALAKQAVSLRELKGAQAALQRLQRKK